MKRKQTKLLDLLRMTPSERAAFTAGFERATPHPSCIVQRRGVCGGRPILFGHRIWPEVLWSFIDDGWANKRILEQYPTLTHADLRLCRALLKEARLYVRRVDRERRKR